MASTMRASSAAFLIQAPSFCVYIAYFVRADHPPCRLRTRLERIADHDRNLVAHVLGRARGNEDVGRIARAVRRLRRLRGGLGQRVADRLAAAVTPCRRPSRRTGRAASAAPPPGAAGARRVAAALLCAVRRRRRGFVAWRRGLLRPGGRASARRPTKRDGEPQRSEQIDLRSSGLPRHSRPEVIEITGEIGNVKASVPSRPRRPALSNEPA